MNTCNLDRKKQKVNKLLSAHVEGKCECYPDPKKVIEEIVSGDWDEHQINVILEFETLPIKQKKKQCWRSYIRFRKENYLEGDLPQEHMDEIISLYKRVVKKPNLDIIEDYDNELRHFYLLILGMMPTPSQTSLVFSLINSLAISIEAEDFGNSQRLVNEIYEYL
jgi:hypothetical protein